MNLRDVEDLGFRPIQYEDEELFRNFFFKFKERKCYSSSWLYLTQAARGMGRLGSYFYQDEEFLVSLGYHHNHFVLIHPIGRVPDNFIQKIESLYNLTDRPIFLKKVSKGKKTKIRRLTKNTNLKLVSTNQYPWPILKNNKIDVIPGRELEKNDDDTFPEIVINIPLVLKTTFDSENIGKRIRNVKGKLRQCENLASEIKYLTISKTNKTDVEEMIKYHFGQDETNIEAYRNMIEILSRRQDNEIYTNFVAKYKEKYIGFFASEKLNKFSAGLYASIALREFKGLSETLHFKMFDELTKQGIKYLNLGGSEIKTLHEFKLKFTYGRKELFETRKIPIIVLKKQQ